MALSDADAQRGQRVKLVRDARGETQPEFAKALEQESGTRYDASEVSRLETGNRVATWEDVRAVAALDPLDRGRDWLGWDVGGESGAATTPKPAPDAKETQALDKVRIARIADALSPAARRQGKRRKRNDR